MNSSNKTFLPTKHYKNRNWFIIDCSGQKLGRLSTIIASLLKGKTKPYYHPSIDMGDYVILINADSILINETSQHYLVHNPGRPGHSLKIRNISESLPEFSIQHAVKGMLSQVEKKRLIKRLNIYKDQHHPHQAQNPIKIDIGNFPNNLEGNPLQ